MMAQLNRRGGEITLTMHFYLPEYSKDREIQRLIPKEGIEEGQLCAEMNGAAVSSRSATRERPGRVWDC